GGLFQLTEIGRHTRSSGSNVLDPATLDVDAAPPPPIASICAVSRRGRSREKSARWWKSSAFSNRWFELNFNILSDNAGRQIGAYQ
ncbi:hypothetical protein SB724_20870, partial [Bacillus sp. SIMBA_031]|uniref:hypothetical protein n=1 Tax=Bacillus sp. SIMBA_031 TaxID=3085774 RepID=UPI00397E7D7C